MTTVYLAGGVSPHDGGGAGEAGGGLGGGGADGGAAAVAGQLARRVAAVRVRN